MLYPAAKVVLKVLYKFYFKKFTVIGKENVPKSGPAILCANHISYFDPITISVYLDRMPCFMAKKELFDHKWLAPIIKDLRAFPVDRNKNDMSAIKTAIKCLKNGDMLGIFLQGGIRKDGEEKALKAGTALIALKSNAPIVPIHIEGTFRFRSRVSVTYGEPITLEQYQGQRIRSEQLMEISEDLMKKIFSL